MLLSNLDPRGGEEAEFFGLEMPDGFWICLMELKMCSASALWMESAVVVVLEVVGENLPEVASVERTGGPMVSTEWEFVGVDRLWDEEESSEELGTSGEMTQ